MELKKIILISLSIVIINNLLGIVFAPSEIFLTPLVIIGLIIFILLSNEKLSIYYKVIIFFVFVILNDILIKLFAPGVHDREGLAWIYLFFLIGIVPSYLFFLIYLILNKKISIVSKLLCTILFPSLFYMYYLHFFTLGIESVNR